jgi:hypothetical protein
MSRAWVRDMQRRAAQIGRWQRTMGQARQRYQRIHRDLIRLRPDWVPGTDPIDEAKTCDLVCYSTVDAPLSPEQWEALVQWHADAEQFDLQVLHILPLICETCQANIEASGLLSSGGESAFAVALDGFLTWLERFKSPEGRRNALRMIESLPERRASLTLGTTEHSESTIDNGAMRVGSNPPKKADN